MECACMSALCASVCACEYASNLPSFISGTWFQGQYIWIELLEPHQANRWPSSSQPGHQYWHVCEGAASTGLIPSASWAFWTEWKCWESQQSQSYCCQLAQGHLPSWCLAQPRSYPLWGQQPSRFVHYRSYNGTKMLLFLHHIVSLIKQTEQENTKTFECAGLEA